MGHAVARELLMPTLTVYPMVHVTCSDAGVAQVGCLTNTCMERLNHNG